MRKLMLPFVSAAEGRSATITVPAPGLLDDVERSFAMKRYIGDRIHIVNTDIGISPSGQMAAAGRSNDPPLPTSGARQV
jgi:hypothetical protein